MNKFDSLKNFLISIRLVTCKSTIFRGRYYFSIHDVISFLFTIIHLIEINSQEQNLAILFTPNQYHQLHKKLRIGKRMQLAHSDPSY